MKSSIFVHGLQAAGLISLLIGLTHTFFHRIFGWRQAFASMSVRNAKVLTTIHIGATIFLFLVGILTFRYADLLAQPTEPALVLCLALSLFWTWRLLWQVTYLKPPPIKDGSRVVVLSYVFILLFAILVITYSAPVVAHLCSTQFSS